MNGKDTPDVLCQTNIIQMPVKIVRNKHIFGIHSADFVCFKLVASQNLSVKSNEYIYICIMSLIRVTYTTFQ